MVIKMKDLRLVIAKNIQALRTENGLTQLELAEMLNYSDKAVSKWERAEAIPDVTVLKQLADRFGVSVDYLLEEEHSCSVSQKKMQMLVRRNRLIITLVSIIGVFALATVVFSVLIMLRLPIAPWLVFVYSIPVASIVSLVLNSVWGKSSYNLIIISVLIWSLLSSLYLTLFMCFEKNIWSIFLVGIPSQAILLVLSGMSGVINRKEKTNRNGAIASNSESAEKTE